ncbi:hypothetical protein CYY_002150 [Polysphondylium violaceum]|uniref:Uncharacterized protein n=1 Tax=Polysphondylium violaceum TaxID=133409 RepID=A0A8J4PYX2_9MYCE|nr:hypothetical protein CYY_002150 [Polysphondylium violaceum]
MSNDKVNMTSNDEDTKKQILYNEISEKLQQLSELNDRLKEQNLQLLRQKEQNESIIDSIKQESESKSIQISLYESKVKEYKLKLKLKDEESKKLGFLNEELTEWKDTHRITDENYLRLKEMLRLKDDAINSLSIQLEQAMNKNSLLSESLKEAGDRGILFERDESFNINSASKQLLDYQKVLAYHKIKAVEDKYATIKNINLGLQKAIQELSVENEKYKYTLETIIKNNNNDSSNSNSNNNGNTGKS